MEHTIVQANASHKKEVEWAWTPFVSMHKFLDSHFVMDCELNFEWLRHATSGIGKRILKTLNRIYWLGNFWNFAKPFLRLAAIYGKFLKVSMKLPNDLQELLRELGEI